jgi:hypothetical protein
MALPPSPHTGIVFSAFKIIYSSSNLSILLVNVYFLISTDLLAGVLLGPLYNAEKYKASFTLIKHITLPNLLTVNSMEILLVLASIIPRAIIKLGWLLKLN